MPTTARLVASLFFAALGWFTADLIKPLLQEGTAVGLFSPISAGFGLLVGWTFTGRRADSWRGTGPGFGRGTGRGTGLGIGLTSSFLLAFWVLLTFSGYDMLQKSLHKAYDGPVAALQDMFVIGVDYARLAATSPEVVVTLVVGGLFIGWLTEKVARRWS